MLGGGKVFSYKTANGMQIRTWLAMGIAIIEELA